MIDVTLFLKLSPIKLPLENLMYDEILSHAKNCSSDDKALSFYIQHCYSEVALILSKNKSLSKRIRDCLWANWFDFIFCHREVRYIEMLINSFRKK